MKQKIVGDYYAGNESIRLIIREGHGGNFFGVPERGATARIEIGGDQSWGIALSSLFHEIFEYLFDQLKCRFEASNDFSQELSSYLFVVSHLNFSDVCARSAEYVDECLPDFKKAYKLWNKKKKETKK